MALVDDHAVYTALMTPGEPFDLLLDPVRDRPTWMADAFCSEYPEVEFVPTPPRPGRVSAAEEAAMAICRRCPVVDDCLAFALEHQEVGVWGATTERQRREMRRAA